MPKITKHGGATIREFQSPAQVLRQRGRLGPYGGEARVETFTAAAAEPVDEDDTRAAVELEPALEGGGSGAGSGEPTNADIRAWAREQGHEVKATGKIPAEVVEAYREAHQGE